MAGVVRPGNPTVCVTLTWLLASRPYGAASVTAFGRTRQVVIVGSNAPVLLIGLFVSVLSVRVSARYWSRSGLLTPGVVADAGRC